MKVETTKFGTIDVEENSIVELPLGLLGFENARKFCMVELSPDTPFKWLQSVELPDLAFILADPMQFFKDYEVEVQDPEVRFLGIANPDDAVVMTLVTIGKDGQIWTNLLGPLVLNARTLVGMQVILQNENYQTKHEIGMLNDTQTLEERQLAKAA